MSRAHSNMNRAKTAVVPTRSAASHLFAPSAKVLDRWQNLAGEETELTGDYTCEERDIADHYAQRFADYEVDLNDRGEA